MQRHESNPYKLQYKSKYEATFSFFSGSLWKRNSENLENEMKNCLSLQCNNKESLRWNTE